MDKDKISCKDYGIVEISEDIQHLTFYNMLNIVYNNFYYDIKAGFDGGYWTKFEKYTFCTYLSTLISEEFHNYLGQNDWPKDKFNTVADNLIESINPELFSGEKVIDAVRDEFDDILDKVVIDFNKYRETEIYKLIRLITFSGFAEIYDKNELVTILNDCSLFSLIEETHMMEEYTNYVNKLLKELKYITIQGRTSLNEIDMSVLHFMLEFNEEEINV